MSAYNVIDEERSGEQANKHTEAGETESVADDEEELRPTVALSKQAKVDSEAIEKVAFADERDHPYGMTLAAEEKWAGREHEKAKTHERQQTQSTLREQGQRPSSMSHQPRPPAILRPKERSVARLITASPCPSHTTARTKLSSTRWRSIASRR